MGGEGGRCKYILLRREVKFGADGPMVTETICSSEVSNPINLMWSVTQLTFLFLSSEEDLSRSNS